MVTAPLAAGSLPKISVVIPTYNRARLVAQTIRSILSQDFRDYELLVLDDASTDDTREVVAGFCDRRIRYLRNNHKLGFVGNWNRGLAVARGDYVTFPGDDDVMLPGCLATLSRVLDDDGDLVMATANINEIDLSGHLLTERSIPAASDVRFEVGEFAKLFAFHGLLNDRGYYLFLPFPPSLYRRRLLQAMQFRFREEAGAGADQVAAVELNLRYPLHFSSRPLLSWRRHAGQLSAPENLGHIRNTIAFLSCAETLLAHELPDFVAPLRAQRLMCEARSAMEALCWDTGDCGARYHERLGELFGALPMPPFPPLPVNQENAMLALLNALHGFRDGIELADGAVLPAIPDNADPLRQARERALVGQLLRWRRVVVRDGIGRRLLRRGVRRVALLGAGMTGYLLAEEFRLHGGPEIVAFMDNEPTRADRIFLNFSVSAPIEVAERLEDLDAVVVTVGRGNDQTAARALSAAGYFGTTAILTWTELLDRP